MTVLDDHDRDERAAAELVGALLARGRLTLPIERARDVVAACGGASCLRTIMRERRFGRGGGYAFPAHERLQWMDWSMADEIEAAWRAADEPLPAAGAATAGGARRCRTCNGACPPQYCYRTHA